MSEDQDSISRALAHGIRPADPGAVSFMQQRACMCALGELLMLRDKVTAPHVGAVAMRVGARILLNHVNNAIEEMTWLLESLRR